MLCSRNRKTARRMGVSAPHATLPYMVPQVAPSGGAWASQHGSKTIFFQTVPSIFAPSLRREVEHLGNARRNSLGPKLTSNHLSKINHGQFFDFVRAECCLCKHVQNPLPKFSNFGRNQTNFYKITNITFFLSPLNIQIHIMFGFCKIECCSSPRPQTFKKFKALQNQKTKSTKSPPRACKIPKLARAPKTSKGVQNRKLPQHQDQKLTKSQG